MRRIKITQSLRDEIELFNEDLFTNTRPKGFRLPKDNLDNFLKKIPRRKYKDYRVYVQKIIDEYQDILNADPLKMKSLIGEFDKIVPNSHLVENVVGKKYTFHEQIVQMMRYEALREKEFPKYLLSSNLRTCVYCNAQSTIAIEPLYYNNLKRKKRKKVLAKLQLDHYYPKSKYPFLCTSFFNLYPTCANCNLAKGDKNAEFELYTLKDDLEVFNFWIEDESILDYWINNDLESLKIYLDSSNGDIDLLHNHNDLFQIQKVYDSQRDIGEELVWKHKANPEVYRNMLNKTFSKIFPDQSVIDRMLIGNYSNPDEIFKRPIAKYTQDIARQLKLID
jgi:5-methylcytosine-specific restriction endonuclease McrA